MSCTRTNTRGSLRSVEAARPALERRRTRGERGGRGRERLYRAWDPIVPRQRVVILIRLGPELFWWGRVNHGESGAAASVEHCRCDPSPVRAPAQGGRRARVLCAWVGHVT